MRDATRSLEEVRRYYDRNSTLFERYGQANQSIHRAVWADGVTNREDAIHFVDELIRKELQNIGENAKVLDLGCGVGGSLVYLAKKLRIQGEGITLSAFQAARGKELIESARLSQIRCREGNFLALPPDLAGIDLAFSIEAFVHTPDDARYFSEAARVLRPGGKLIVCDDFLTERGFAAPSEGELVRLDEFQRGWKVNSLITVERAAQVARSVGLELQSTLDLTPFLELRRPRDLGIALLVAVGQRLFTLRSEYWASLVGGNALQRAIRSGTIAYRYLVFDRS